MGMLAKVKSSFIKENCLVANKIGNHDVSTSLRLVAIFLIVSGHFKFIDYGGGAYFLMLLVGYNFATFKMDLVIKSESIVPIIIMFVKVVMPTMLYTIFLHFYYGSIKWSNIFLVGNFNPVRHPLGFDYWFIEVYVQLLLFFMVALSIPKLRKAIADNPRIMTLVFVVTSIVLFLICEWMWDTSNLARRLPWLLVWLVAFGFSAAYNQSLCEKILYVLLFIISLYLFFGKVHIYLLIAYSILMFRSAFPSLPIFIKRPVYFISSGSLFIYLTHFQSASMVSKIGIVHPFLLTLNALILGSVSFYFYNRIVGRRISKMYHFLDK